MVCGYNLHDPYDSYGSYEPYESYVALNQLHAARRQFGCGWSLLGRCDGIMCGIGKPAPCGMHGWAGFRLAACDVRRSLLTHMLLLGSDVGV